MAGLESQSDTNKDDRTGTVDLESQSKAKETDIVMIQAAKLFEILMELLRLFGNHENVWIGIQATECRLLLEPGCAATHIQLANLYASVGCWDRVAEVRKWTKERHLKSSPGYSWIKITNMMCMFQVEDRSNALVKEILPILDSLECHMKPLDCNLVANSDPND